MAMRKALAMGEAMAAWRLAAIFFVLLVLFSKCAAQPQEDESLQGPDSEWNDDDHAPRVADCHRRFDMAFLDQWFFGGLKKNENNTDQGKETESGGASHSFCLFLRKFFCTEPGRSICPEKNTSQEKELIVAAPKWDIDCYFEASEIIPDVSLPAYSYRVVYDPAVLYTCSDEERLDKLTVGSSEDVKGLVDFLKKINRYNLLVDEPVDNLIRLRNLEANTAHYVHVPALWDDNNYNTVYGLLKFVKDAGIIDRHVRRHVRIKLAQTGLSCRLVNATGFHASTWSIADLVSV